nr:MAG TPA: hypothetical protein [Caudoviricetes sp.]
MLIVSQCSAREVMRLSSAIAVVIRYGTQNIFLSRLRCST